MANYSNALGSLRSLGNARSSSNRQSSMVDYALSQDLIDEQEKLRKKAEKASTYSGRGRLIGALGAGLLTLATGGIASPLLAAAVVGGGSYLGSKTGEKISGGVGGGKFYKNSRTEFTDKLHSGQLKSAAMDAITGYSLAKMPVNLGGEEITGLEAGKAIMKDPSKLINEEVLNSPFGRKLALGKQIVKDPSSYLRALINWAPDDKEEWNRQTGRLI